MWFYTPPDFSDGHCKRTPSRLKVLGFYLLEKDELYKSMVDLGMTDQCKREVVISLLQSGILRCGMFGYVYFHPVAHSFVASPQDALVINRYHRRRFDHRQQYITYNSKRNTCNSCPTCTLLLPYTKRNRCPTCLWANVRPRRNTRVANTNNINPVPEEEETQEDGTKQEEEWTPVEDIMKRRTRHNPTYKGIANVDSDYEFVKAEYEKEKKGEVRSHWAVAVP